MMKRLPLLLLLLLLFSFSATAVLAEGSRINEYLMKGKNSLKDQNFKQAFWYFFVASSLDREEPEPWYFLGHSLYHLKDYRNALAAFQWAKEYDLNDIYLHTANRFIVHCKNKFNDTKTHPVMKKFAKIQPTLWHAHKMMREGEFLTSANLLAIAFKEIPLDFEISSALATCLLRRGNVKKAYKPLITAYRIDKITLIHTLDRFRLPGRNIVKELERYLEREKSFEEFFLTL
jgi:tetratricopeptide (TPR) repeat protein